MKTKWQVWAHLLCTNYSISALKKITKWLRSKDIIELEWIDVYIKDKDKTSYDMTYFMSWYKDDSPTCETYPQLARQIDMRYHVVMALSRQRAKADIKERYKGDDFRIYIPF